MATFDHYLETRLWLAAALELTAAWRDDKAREYPEDTRNGRSANALRVAAYYVRGATASPGVRKLGEIVEDCLASGIDLLAPEPSLAGFPGAESERIAGRYFFDQFAGSPTTEDHEELLADIYDAALRDLAYYDITDGSPLAERLRARGTTATRTAPRAEPSVEPRVTQLVAIADVLVAIADGARAEADGNDRLPELLRPTRLPMLRRQLGVRLAALRALGGPDLERCRKVIEEPPLFATPTVAGVVAALDEVERVTSGSAAT